MAQTAHIGTFPFRSMRVSDLLARLADLPPDAEVLFTLPQYGAFASGMSYTVEKVEAVEVPRREQHFPAVPTFDDETGEEGMSEPYTQVWDAWSGVVIS
jgi:hypothetical protein